eukprot:CAMPEP_0168463368 /NCGR_PEP_ID=MMETSP0228-20121227/55018_1 /TAXON_ID=133427 /ORGANISM="Protoceratium reticulatum, Strain CCCM 535 (=CCMP 1889)" /LENGTH=664 /DNA_ID=CAMNT_0008478819 /DNA_START=104 /DNA_END=2100 /DNA_ORIENTATION=+
MHASPRWKCASHPVLAILFMLWKLDALKTRGPLTDDWFSSFAESESTYSPDGDRSAQAAPGGWDHNSELGNAAWFHESPSGGGKDAWQTHSPGLQPSGRWHVENGGAWSQDYRPAGRAGAGAGRAEWFDSSVKQYDSFGRRMLPDMHSSRRDLLWFERTVNTTLTCDSVGCTASSQLQVFDSRREEAPPLQAEPWPPPDDFDDLYSGERLLWIRVNGQVVSTDCFPMISGCNRTAQAPLFHCLREMPVDTFLGSAGVITISARISDVVDECPYHGHLLAGVPMVTCMVAPLRASPPSAVPELVALFAAQPAACLLSVKVFQTDYDGEDGTAELIDFVRVGGTDLATRLSPGLNPCRAAWTGNPLALSDMTYTLLQNQDVTATFLNGTLDVLAKITPDVDECARDGYLLNGLVELTCSFVGIQAAPPLPVVQPAPAPAPAPAPRPAGVASPPAPTVAPRPAPPPAPLSTGSSGTAVTTGAAVCATTCAGAAASSIAGSTAGSTAGSAAGSTTGPAASTAAGNASPITDAVSSSDAGTLCTQSPADAAPAEAEPAPEAPQAGFMIAPFGRTDTGLELQQQSEVTQATLVDAIEDAQVSQIKVSIFRALTRLRAAQIKEFDTIARIESTSIDDFNDDHHFRVENPLRYIHDNEPAVSTDKYSSFHVD